MGRICLPAPLSQTRFFLLLGFVSLSLPAQAEWWQAAPWVGIPPFEQEYPKEHQFTAGIRQGHKQVITYWMGQEGFNPNHEFVSPRTNEYVSPLHLAVQENRAETVSLLLDAGANVNHAGKGGITALSIACYNGHHEVVQILVNTPGVLIDQTCDDGATPLLFASQEGNVRAVRLHIQAGANPVIRWRVWSGYTKTPRTIAWHQRLVNRIQNPDKCDAYCQIIESLKQAETDWKSEHGLPIRPRHGWNPFRKNAVAPLSEETWLLASTHRPSMSGKGNQEPDRE